MNELKFDTRPQDYRKLIGIGLNYRTHADDLGAVYPDAPVFFFKPEHTLVEGDDPIVLPSRSTRVTAEGELGLVIGRRCVAVDATDALDHVAGVVAVLDQTAEDILQRNPRFLQWSKSYPTFLKVSPAIVPIEAARAAGGDDLLQLVVRTEINGTVHRRLPVSDMIFAPAQLISALSHTMPLNPGDLICTGTPGAARLTYSDIVTGVVEGLSQVEAAVRDETTSRAKPIDR